MLFVNRNISYILVDVNYNRNQVTFYSLIARDKTQIY